MTIRTRERTIAATLLMVLLGIGAAVYLLFGDLLANHFTLYRDRYFEYRPNTPVVASPDVAGTKPANAVPILMYHGITQEDDGVNTPQELFIEQMEALKRAGYSTISLGEFDLFRQGTFTLPSKPIIITFDDGRKDSFNPADSILAALGFRATLFVATGPAVHGESFYLSPDDLRRVQATGRWDIEAHGRESHEPVAIVADENAPKGRFLSSRKYLPDLGRIETVEEFTSRIRQDYMNGNNDLREWLGITPRYFAIPLSDYGIIPVSNYPESLDINNAIVKSMYRMAFIETNDPVDPANVQFSPYNFANDDAYVVRRLEVGGLSADQLLGILDQFAPRPPSFRLSGTTGARIDGIASVGTSESRDAVQLAALETNLTAMFIIGQEGWANYRAVATLRRAGARSVSVVGRYQDAANYVLCGTTDNGFFIRAILHGVSSDLRAPVLKPDAAQADQVTLTLQFSGTTATCSVNGTTLFSGVVVPFRDGKSGVKIWDDRQTARADILQFDVSPIGIQ